MIRKIFEKVIKKFGYSQEDNYFVLGYCNNELFLKYKAYSWESAKIHYEYIKEFGNYSEGSLVFCSTGEVFAHFSIEREANGTRLAEWTAD